MPTWLLIAIMLIVVCSVFAYVTTLICNHKYNSLWQVIAYTSSDCCKVQDDVMQIIDKHITKLEEVVE